MEELLSPAGGGFADASSWLGFFVADADGSGVGAAGVLERILAVGPSADSVKALTEIDTAALDEHSRVLYALAWDRARSWMDAQAVAADLAVMGAEPLDQHDSGVHEWRVALRRSRRSAENRASLVRELTERLPATLAALAAGRITLAHVHVLLDELVGQPSAVCAEVEERVLGQAAEQTPRQLREAARRAVLKVDPAAAARKAKAERSDRTVWLSPLPDAVAMLTLRGPAEDLLRIFGTAQAVARRRGKDDPRTLSQATYDAIRDRLLGDAPAAPVVEVGVVVGLGTLTGLSDDPAVLEGYGPIPAPLARLLAGEEGARWRRFLMADRDGSLLDVGRDTYRPSAALRRFLVARDSTCRAAGCATPATSCDIDHRVPWPDGPTTRTNLGCWCRTDHNLKTHVGWRVDDDGAGALTITTRAGFSYSTRPFDYRSVAPPRRDPQDEDPPLAAEDPPPF